ncbi:MAG: hypothetical protein Q7R40_02930 [Phaeospirillum sp.]|nr:hypothetical protein [Phaeospirillum sp.]
MAGRKSTGYRAVVLSTYFGDFGTVKGMKVAGTGGVSFSGYAKDGLLRIGINECGDAHVASISVPVAIAEPHITNTENPAKSLCMPPSTSNCSGRVCCMTPLASDYKRADVFVIVGNYGLMGRCRARKWAALAPTVTAGNGLAANPSADRGPGRSSAQVAGEEDEHWPGADA